MHPPILALMDYLGPVLGALAFVAGLSLVREPLRLRINALLVAGASGAYMGGGFGLWEVAFAVVALAVAYPAQSSYRFVALAWFMHASWDLLHHLYGQSIWPFMPTSSFGCLIFDSLIGLWLLAGAPSPWPSRHGATVAVH